LVLICHGLPYGLARHGAIGVDLFFGLSGFLIGTRLLEERRRTARIHLVAFYIRRSFRILPPYLAYLVALTALAAVGVLATPGRELASCLLFVRNYLIPTAGGGWYTGHFWSLAVEEHFYLIWPVLLIVWGARNAAWKVAMLAGAVAAWRIVEF